MLDFMDQGSIMDTSLLRAREGMGPANSRQPHQEMKVPNPTGVSRSPADEVIVVLSACEKAGSFFYGSNYPLTGTGDIQNEETIYVGISY